MKYIKYLLFAFLLLIPFKVNASGNFNLTGCSQSKSGQEISCLLSGPSCNTFKGSLVLPEGFKFYGTIAVKDNGYSSNGSGTNLSFTRSNSSSTNPSISVIKIKAPTVTKDTKYNLSISNISYTLTSSSTSKTDSDISVAMTVYANATSKSTTTTPTTTKASDNATPFSIVFDSNGGDISNQTNTCKPSGGKCIIDLTGLKAPKKNGTAFTGWGNQKTCTSGNLKTYTATANATLYACYSTSSTGTTTAATNTTSSLYLKSLTIDGQQFEFSKYKFEYDLKVLYDVSSISLTAIAEKDSTVVTYSPANKTDLVVGDNSIKVILSEGDNITYYTVNIKRLAEGEAIEEKSSDATLASITLGKYAIEYKPTVTNYLLTADYGTTKIDVKAVANSPKAKFAIAGNEAIADGSIITISVKAEDGTINIYKINVSVNTFFEQYKTYIIAGGVSLFCLIVYFIVLNDKKKKNKKKPIVVKKKNDQIKTVQNKEPEIETL